MRTNTAANDPTIMQFPEAFEPFAKLQGVPFILVPLRTLPGGQVAVGALSPQAKAADAPKPTSAAPSRPVATTSPRATARHTSPFGYALKDRRTHPADLPPARLDVYKALRRARRPLTVREAADAAKHPKETTQQLLVALVDAGIAVRAPIKTIRTPEGPKSSVPLKAGRRQAAAGARGAHQKAADRRR